MATHTLVPKPHATTASIDYLASPTALSALPTTAGYTDYVATGDTDFAECLRAPLDGKFLTATGGGSAVYWIFEDDGVIPLTATIESVQLVVRHTATGAGAYANVFFDAIGTGSIYGTMRYTSAERVDTLNGATTFNLLRFPLDAPADQDISVVPAFQTFATVTATSTAFTTNPDTLATWARSELFTFGTGGEGVWTTNIACDAGGTYILDYVALIVTYAGGGNPEDGAVYVLDVDEPPIRKFDGATDKLIAKIPKSLV